MQEITADIIGTEPVAPAPEATTDSTAAEADTSTADTEQQLASEITELWTIHTDAQSVVKKTQQELKNIRGRLGANLYEMKQLLAKAGRGRAGKWSSFLAEHGISRTTADRLCQAHAKKLTPENGTTGSVPEMTDEEIAELAKAVWKKLAKKLGTKQVAFAFLGRLIAESGLGNFKFHRGTDRGLALVDPDAVSTAPSTDGSAAVPTNAA